MFRAHVKTTNQQQENYLQKLKELTKRLEPISKTRRDEIGREIIGKVDRDRQPT